MHKLFLLSPTRKALLLFAAVSLGFARLMVFLPLRWWPRPPAVSLCTRCGASDVLWAIDVASRCIPRPTCLVRALAAQWLLAWTGHHAEIRVGVRRNGSAHYHAHAWVELNHRVVLGDIGLSDFIPVLTLTPKVLPLA